ncbi:MAG: DoxX family membrane protein [Reichenbachiella sp.]|uniref:DoxX family membrane protein n=1 Tax=Reichenbachiella sp. TaxID=2184521 RepID=UPI0029667629|nr:DoxX family membrane protein [Reichenbachiella sp.]MDW3212124.1 DoxX family membrane protein [Reichenbachiella sp.]
MRTKINTGVRVIFGVALIAFGSDKFLEFMPHGHVMTETLMNAFMGLMANKFILPTVGIIEMLVGLSLLTNRFTNLSLLALFPISFGIIAFHLAVDLPGIIPGVAVANLNVYMLFRKRNELAILLKP